MDMLALAETNIAVNSGTVITVLLVILLVLAIVYFAKRV